GSEGAASLDAARAAAEELGYPVLLKAAAGGGGKGMRTVRDGADLADLYDRASSEAQAAFGDGSLYVEKVITPARHVEIQGLCEVRTDAGYKLSHGGRAAPRNGHAIELRINAEDPARDFAPAPGRIERFRPPLGPGVRVDTFVEEGTTISPYYDSLIAKVIVL